MTEGAHSWHMESLEIGQRLSRWESVRVILRCDKTSPHAASPTRLPNFTSHECAEVSEEVDEERWQDGRVSDNAWSQRTDLISVFAEIAIRHIGALARSERPCVDARASAAYISNLTMFDKTSIPTLSDDDPNDELIPFEYGKLLPESIIIALFKPSKLTTSVPGMVQLCQGDFQLLMEQEEYYFSKPHPLILNKGLDDH
ncbi:hypothetical protein CPB84DRAFT_1755015 [Gymnopilus junonius]|uniref:Uncharacterized protein n=1 Tax=Gymnopilus junonius TaxID=109634 RepID=A0A9P5N827_GYMJU|nr:hypothetical protein CPB84DRAFT_1755015 [Gymnopilus junonius]